MLKFSVVYHHQEKMFFEEITLDNSQSKVSPIPCCLSSQHGHLPGDLFCDRVESASL